MIHKRAVFVSTALFDFYSEIEYYLLGDKTP